MYNNRTGTYVQPNSFQMLHTRYNVKLIKLISRSDVVMLEIGNIKRNTVHEASNKLNVDVACLSTEKLSKSDNF